MALSGFLFSFKSNHETTLVLVMVVLGFENGWVVLLVGYWFHFGFMAFN